MTARISLIVITALRYSDESNDQKWDSWLRSVWSDPFITFLSCCSPSLRLYIRATLRGLQTVAINVISLWKTSTSS